MCLAYSGDINYTITLFMLFTFTFCHPLEEIKEKEITQTKTLVSGILQRKH